MNFSAYLSQILMILLLAFATLLGAQVKRWYSRLATSEIKQAVCRTVVRFVEQVYTDLHGKEKLTAAMARASAILEEYGISITEYELVSMLEAAVNEFNNAFRKDEPPDAYEGAHAAERAREWEAVETLVDQQSKAEDEHLREYKISP